MNTDLLTFLDTQAARLTPADLAGLAGRMPALRERFDAVVGRETPELGGQLEFLAQVVEDDAGGMNDALPGACRREAAFALLYVERTGHSSPLGTTHKVALGEELALVNAVLCRHEAALRASPRGHLWTWELGPLNFNQVLRARLHAHLAGAA